jgi:predicted GNAT family acetyltransferase
MTASVVDVPERHRYELRDGNVLVGLVEYHLYGDELALLHTEIGDEFGGHGFGGQLVQAVLEDAKAKGMRVLPYCAFARAWIGKHLDYLDLVPEAYRDRFQLPVSIKD